MEKTITKPSLKLPKTAIWDCGSSLYDSFELKAFEKQLDSAIASRTMSMPHLSSSRQAPPVMSKKPSSSKISRSLNRLIRSVFRPKCNSSTKSFEQERLKNSQGSSTFYDHRGVLSTIPEAPEFDALSPEIRSLVRRTASDRFGAAAVSIGISCA